MGRHPKDYCLRKSENSIGNGTTTVNSITRKRKNRSSQLHTNETTDEKQTISEDETTSQELNNAKLSSNSPKHKKFSSEAVEGDSGTTTASPKPSEPINMGPKHRILHSQPSVTQFNGNVLQLLAEGALKNSNSSLQGASIAVIGANGEQFLLPIGSAFGLTANVPQTNLHVKQNDVRDETSDQKLRNLSDLISMSSTNQPTNSASDVASNYSPSSYGKSTTTSPMKDDDEMLYLTNGTSHPDRKREIRLLKNRDAARECRRKKKEYIKCLESRVAGLEAQNKTLIEELKALKELYCKSFAEHEDPALTMREQPRAQQSTSLQNSLSSQNVVLTLGGNPVIAHFPQKLAEDSQASSLGQIQLKSLSSFGAGQSIPLAQNALAGNQVISQLKSDDEEETPLGLSQLQLKSLSSFNASQAIPLCTSSMSGGTYTPASAGPQLVLLRTNPPTMAAVTSNSANVMALGAANGNQLNFASPISLSLPMSSSGN